MVNPLQQTVKRKTKRKTVANSIFRNIAADMPRQNQRVATGLQEAAKMGVQAQLGQIGQAGQGPLSVQQVQQAGAQAAAQQGQATLQAQQQQAQKAMQASQQAAKVEAEETQQRLREREFGIKKKANVLERQLGVYDEKLKNELFDKNIKFQKDELGRTLFNERQLMDYKIYSTKSKIEFRKFEQDMRNMSRRRIKMLDVSLAKIKQELRQQFDKDQLELNQEQKMRLLKAKQAIEEKIARAQANAANRASMFSSAGTIIGAGIGAILAVPTGGLSVAAGAAIGASIGTGVGNIAAGATAEKPNYNRGVDVRNY